jgi:hypothetical protein
MLAEGRDKLHDSYILTDIELPSGKYENVLALQTLNLPISATTRKYLDGRANGYL